jgi:hypothetical protein
LAVRNFGGEELDDLVSAGEDHVPVTPCGVLGVGEGDLVRVAGVPGVFGGLDLGQGAVEIERREGRARFGHGRAVLHGAKG